MQNRQISNTAINQIMLIVIIILICLLVFKNLTYYLPGFLGAITLYVLFRNSYFKLTEQKGVKKSLASLLIIISSLVFIVLPLWALIDYLIPQLTSFFANKDVIISKFNSIKEYMSDKPVLKEIDMSDSALLQIVSSLTKYVPSIINSVAEVAINIVVALFVLYFMQVHGRAMESYIASMIPFSKQSKHELWTEFFMMVRSNAIGIPILGAVQGAVAIIGYWIFGVENYVFWGILTGAASIIPILGTMAVWVPISIIVLSSGETANAIGLMLYCFILVGGIDNVLRFTLLKQLGDVPPLITVFGVLFGLNVFGMLGLIFGPLILSSIGLLIKVYRNEYGTSKTPPIITTSSGDVDISSGPIIDK